MGSIQSKGNLSINHKALRLLHDRFIGKIESSGELVALIPQMDEAMHLAVNGVLKALEARSSLFPLLRWMQISDAINLLNKAVNADPESPEVRFMRWIVQLEIPAFLGFSVHVHEDYKFLLKAFEQGAFSDDEEFRQYLAAKLQLA